MATQAILDQYGWRTVRIPGGSTDGSAGATGGIGKTWVPPLGGASVIVPGAVVEPGYADRLAEAGYQPQKVGEASPEKWRELLQRSQGVLLALIVVLALAAWSTRID